MDKSKSAIHIFDSKAVEYAEKYMDVTLYQKSLDFLCSNIEKENAKVLEVACGPGNVTKYILDKRPDLQILGIDLSPKMLDIAREINPTAEFRKMDCRQINDLEEKFDAIICGFGLPYLSKEEALQMIADVALSLNKDGIFYLSTMEDDYSKSGNVTSSSDPTIEMFIHYHESAYLKRAFVENNLDLMYSENLLHPQQVGTTARDLVMVGKVSKNTN